MRKLILTLVVMAAVVNAGNENAYVVAMKDNVGIYEHRIRGVFEAPLFTVDKADRLQVVATEKGKIQIRTVDSRTGWVEKNNVRTVSSRSFLFERIDVTGYIDNPDMVVILAGDGPGEEPLRLDRSFRESLSENVDRETVDRLTK